jgi:hypothetical protein
MVTIKVASPRGHDVLELAPADAVAKLRGFLNDKKFVYINGRIVTAATPITEEMVTTAEAITVAPNLQGG